MKKLPAILGDHCKKLMLSTALIFTSSSMCQAAPANDSFVAAQLISSQTGSVTGTTVNATREPSEPFHAGYPGNGSVWYRWTAPANGLIKFTVVGSGRDCLLGVYRGSQINNLVPVASNYGYLQSSVSFAVTFGAVYLVAVDSLTLQGSTILDWAVPPPPPR